MYGQGSYNSQFGRGPPPPLQPPYRHQPPGPPPLPPHFQQGSLAPPPIFQQGLPIYQHSPPVPHPAVRQISPDAGANNSQTYVPPNPAAHGSTPLPHMCSTDQQKMQLSSHLGTQNVHHMPASMPPHPPRELTPPSATVYRASVQLQSQQPGGEQDLPYMLNQPPPPPPPTSSSFTSDPFGSVVQSTGRNSRMPSLVSLPPPPPLPFNPPPIPSSRPPSTSPSSSSAHHETASNLTSSSKPFCSKVSTSDFFDKDVITYQVRHNVHQFDGSLIQEGSPSPPKPTEEKVVQKIEDLCQLIAKNGPDYEDLVHQNESGNPEFEFLFAGDPGSDAEIAHEYFLWTKKKCMLACKLNEKRSESPLRISGTDSSLQSNHLEVASRTYSPPDSDMEMEDDITLPGNDPGVNHSIEGTSGYDLIYSELDVKELSHKQQMTESKRAASTAPVILEEVDRVVSKHDLAALERPAAKVCSPVISSADECPLNRNIEKSATTSVDDKFSSGALSVAKGVYSEKKSSQLIEGGSPFRLLHNYASDDISDNDQEAHGASALKDTSSVAVGASSPHKNIGLNISPKSVNFHEASGREPEEIVMASITSGTTDENVLHKHKNQAYVGHAESPQDFQKKNALEDAGVEICLNGNLQKEYAEKGAKSASNSLKVDEFGRLVREGASESDSDDSRYTGRQGKRGRSRSRSPLGRRRKGRLWRRRERRSRSRSWSPRKRRSRSRSPRNRRNSRSRSPRNRRSSRSRSPRNRRSRSRSPVSKRVSSFCGDRMRRDRSQIPGCFDFRRGRCYRGASCRYLHHDSEKGDGSKCRRSKQQFMEVPPIPKDSNFEGEVRHNLQKESDQQHHVVKSSKMQLGQEMPGSFDQDTRLVDPHTVKSDTFKSHGDASPDILPRENSVTMPSQAKLHDPLLQNAECLPQQTDNSSISDSSPEQTPMNSVNKLPASEALPNSIEFRHNSAQLPPPPPCSQGATAHNMTQPPGDYNLVPESASFASQAASGERFRSNMIPSQQSNFFLPPIPSWTPLPPPPPIVSSQIRTYAAELPTPSQVGDFQQRSFHPMQEPNRSISCSEDFSSKPLPPYNLQSQQFTVQGLLREDQLSHLPTLGLRTSSSFPQGDNQLVPTTFSQELSASKLQPSPGDNLHPGELLKSTSHIHLHLNQQQPPYSVHHSVSISSSSKLPPDLQEVNQSSHPLNLEGSRNSTYYPHASTFGQSLSSKLSIDACRQEVTTYCGKYASPFDMSHAQVEVRDTGSVGSRQATSSPNSPKAVGQNFPRSGGDQYDPLLDSFEPSSNLSYKTNNVNKWEPSSDSDIMLGHSGSNKPLDVEENNKNKGNGGVVGVAATITAFNEEYGESADAEVGAVENESPNNPNGAGNLNSGEIEIDPIKSPSKSKNKESRSMKLFKVALADFVKEVLKPSWREGNMSKEAFKTIVKKTVDKVSGAMKSHQIPKSQAKIDQYIVSSQRKLTKLVMGYVDKYVKM